MKYLCITSKMKTLIQHSLSFLFGLYFLLAGTGFNVVNYCCNICEDEGVEAIIIESKHIQHDHKMSCCDEDMHRKMSVDNVLHHTNTCHLTRYNVEVSPVSSILELKNVTEYEVNLFSNIQFVTFDVFISSNNLELKLPPPEQVLLKSGRDILAYNAILLI